MSLAFCSATGRIQGKKIKMTRIIKVSRLAIDGMEVKEVHLGEARKIVEDAYAQGRFVVTQQTGELIDEITPEVEEILIIEAVGGG